MAFIAKHCFKRRLGRESA